MKSLFASGVFLLGFSAQAKMVMSCVTEFPTTSYFLSEIEQGYELMVYHHNGVDFMPIHDGTVTLNQAPKLVERAEKMKKIGQQALVRFSKQQCSTEGGGLWRCYSKGEVLLGGLKVKDVGFSMGAKFTNYQGYEWKSTETFFHLNLDGENLMIQLSFPEGACKAL